jgi:hypothetical protein
MNSLVMDFTVRLGDILTMAGLLGGGALVIAMMRADMRILATRVGAVETSFGSFSASVDRKLDGITTILVEQAKHDQRISHVEDTLKLMQFGKTTATQ